MFTDCLFIIGVRECLAFAEGSACGWGKAKCATCGMAIKLVLKNVRWGKNKKLGVGKERRLTRCPMVIWSVCWSPVKMV
jgi:hypothetical protein